MKKLIEKKLIQEEINRINDLMGNKQIITEQPVFFKKVADDVVKYFDTVWGTAKKLKDEDVWQVGLTRVSKEMEELFTFLVENPEFWEQLTVAQKRLIATIMRSDTAYVDSTWKSFLKALDTELGESESDFLAKLLKKQQQTGQPIQEILEDFFGDPYLAGLFYKKIDDGLEGLPEIITRAKKPKSYLELYKNIEPGFMKLLKAQYIDGIFKSKEKIIKEIEAELDTISYKLLNKQGSKQKITKNMEVILNKLLAMKKSTYEEIEYSFKKYLTDNNIFKNDAEAQAFLQNPRIKNLLEDMASDADASVMLPLKQKWRAFGQMFDIVGLGKFLAKKNGGKLDDTTMKSAAQRFGNFILWKDPQGWKEVQRAFARTGVSGMWIDRMLGLVIINFGLIPVISGAIESILVNDDVKENIEVYKKLKIMCDENVLPVDVCTEVNDMKTSYISEKEWYDYVWGNMPVGIDKGWWNLAAGTYIDDFLKTTFDLLVKLGTGSETKWDDVQSVFSDVFAKQKNSLEKIGWDDSKNEVTNFQILVKKGADEKNIKKIAESPEGFKAWADVNNYNVTSPYGTKPGIGVAYKANDTKKVNIEFEWDSANNTFKQKVTETPEGFKSWAANNGYTIITPYDDNTGIGTAYKNDDVSQSPVTFEWDTNTNNTFKPL
jgi:hypothetical protein